MDEPDARRTIEKAAQVLSHCEEFFRHQAEMNAAAHLASKVMYPPIYSSIQSVLQGIRTFQQANPQPPESEIP